MAWAVSLTCGAPRRFAPTPAPLTAMTAPASSRSPRRKGLWALLLLVVLPIAAFALWTFAAFRIPAYSSGPRAGYNQKISRKGWVCKTWEGELAISNIPGQAPEVFRYSVRDDAVAQQLLSLAGQRVVLTYEQRKGIPTSCFGETEYFATAVRQATDAPFPAAYPGAAVPGAGAPAAVPPNAAPQNVPPQNAPPAAAPAAPR